MLTTAEAKKALAIVALAIFNGANDGHLDAIDMVDSINRRAAEVECPVSEAGKRCKIARKIRTLAFFTLKNEVADSMKQCTTHDGLQQLITAQARLSVIIDAAARVIKNNNGE